MAYALDAARSSDECRQQKDYDPEKGIARKEVAVITAEPTPAADPELRAGHKIHCKTAIIDVAISLVPLYFVAFAALANIRDGTLASSFQNTVVFKMATVNPTLFPIVFTLIMAKLLKAIANWKLERGATVGLIQHLLGSRSLVSSVMTPVKLRTSSLLVPLLIMVWALNPIGGQMSLRIVSKQSNTTRLDTPFYYLDLLNSQTPQEGNLQGLMDINFNSALSSPVSAKNGSEDIYSNLQIPLLEDLQGWQMDSEGWIDVMNTGSKGIAGAVLESLHVPHTSSQLLYSSLLGIPITRGSTDLPALATNSTILDKIDQIKSDLFGSDVVSTHSLFTFETSYMYANCSLERGDVVPSTIGYDALANVTKSSWGISVGATVTNEDGLTIAYDSTHNRNSTTARRIGLESWLAYDNYTDDTLNIDLSEAWCNLTTTYVEVEAYCQNQINCTVSKLRRSKQTHPNTVLTVFDGIHLPAYTSPDDFSGDLLAYYDDVLAPWWFGAFVNSTRSQPTATITNDLTPLEAYFHDTVTPHVYAINGNGGTDYIPRPIHEVGPELFSTRFTQLLNTYWLSTTAPYTVVGGVSYRVDSDSAGGIANFKGDGILGTSQGSLYIETIVLRCHKPFLAILLVVSVLLCAGGLLTAYLDATRKGPDVLDDFVNSLRHSPYVHVEQGPSMEDGQEKARRLRQTVVQMGDVSPGMEHGYVAIGTPSAAQPIERLTHKRYYQ